METSSSSGTASPRPRRERPSLFRRRAERLLRVKSADKPAIYAQVFDSTDPGNLNYFLEILLSAGIATLGLVLNSPAVVIGAMLISPLMGPILAIGLSFAASDLYLGIRSYVSLMVGVAIAVSFSAALVWILPFQQPTAEILARTAPNLLDLGVALFSGLAGSIVLCRGGGGGGVTALPGVAIAVALMPPLCTVGFGVGSGFDWAIISGAGLLFLTNLAAISFSAFVVFWTVNMDSREVRERVAEAEIERSKDDWMAPIMQRLRFASAIGGVGRVRWRFLMLAFILMLLGRPLLQSLNRVRDEAIARTAVREAVRSLARPEDIVQQQIDLKGQAVNVRLIVAGVVEPAKREAAERELIRRTGRPAEIAVREVAREADVAALRQSFQQPDIPVPQTIEEARLEHFGKVDAAVRELWPAGYGEITFTELGFRARQTLARIAYKAEKPIAEETRAVLQQALQVRLGLPALDVVLDFERVRPPRRRK